MHHMYKHFFTTENHALACQKQRVNLVHVGANVSFYYFFFPSETLNEEIYWVCQSLLTCDASARWRTSDRRLNSDKTLLIRDGVLNMSALLVLVNHVLYTSVNQAMHL